MGKELIDFSEARWDRPDYHPALARGVSYCAKIGECEFIDFKEEFHKCKAELVHDILCLANAHSECVRYILYGISETDVAVLKERFEYENIAKYVKGVTGEDFATEQTTITQILDGCGLNKNLSNYVHLHKFELEDRSSLIRDTSGKYVTSEKRLLILHIENVPLKPFFLTKDYSDKKGNKDKVVRAGVFYSRHCDSNVHIDSTATDGEIEIMYRERFGIDKTPRDKAFMYIENPDDWIYDETNGFIYCLNDPKYKIKRREKTNFEISEEARTHIKSRPETQQMRPESYYMEYDGCDMGVHVDVIIISEKTVLPDISIETVSGHVFRIVLLKTSRANKNRKQLSQEGVKKICEIIQNDYNRRNKTNICLDDTLKDYEVAIPKGGTCIDGDRCNHEYWADYYLMSTKLQ